MAINIASGFHLGSKSPIDDRMVVENENARFGIVNKYEGLDVFQRDIGVSYKYIGKDENGDDIWFETYNKSGSIHISGGVVDGALEIQGNLNMRNNNILQIKSITFEKPTIPNVTCVPVGESIELTIQYLQVSNITHYEVWNSIGDETNYSKIAEIPYFSINEDVIVKDTSFKSKSRVYYRVYAINNNTYSDPCRVNSMVTVEAPPAEFTYIDMGNKIFFFNITCAETRILRGFELYIQNANTLEELSTNDEPPENIPSINLGLVNTYVYKADSNMVGDYFKFWVKSVTDLQEW